MLSRRQLFGGLSLLPFAGGLASCAARATTAPPTSSGGGTAVLPEYVAPGPSWNGAAKSGGVPAVFPGGNVTADPISRTTAKPAIHWVVPSGMVLAPGQDIIIGVDADAGGAAATPGAAPALSGVKQVDFWVEGTIHSVTVPQFLTWTQNGISKTAYGYFIKLRQSDFSAHLTGSEVRIFATAIPNDTTMQNRVIGYDLVNSGIFDGNYPMSVYPRSAANDHSYTVNAANSDVSPNFTTLKKALTQAATDSAEFPLITFTATGNYEAENLANRLAGHGFCTVTHSPGVVATIGRAAAFTPNSPSSWAWTPGWDAIEFRGSGVVFQQRNWTTIELSRSSWFNGCKFTNSIGTRDTNYWNNNGHPYVGPGPLMCWMDGCYAEYCNGMYLNNYYAINCQAKMTGGSVFTGNHYLYNTYVRDFSNNYFRNQTNRISITYTNPGGHTTAQAVRAAGSNLTTGQNLLLKVDGSTVATIPLGFYSTDTNPTVTAVVAAINAFGNGWSASVLNSGGIWPGASIGFNGGDWAFTANCFNTTFSTNATPDPHGEWWQGFGPGSGQARENVLHRNNVLRDNPTDPWINNDDAGNGGSSQDHIIKGNVQLGVGAITYFGGAASGDNSMSHMVFENNTMQQQFSTKQGPVGDKVYSSYRNNITGGANGDGGGADWTNAPPWVNNFYVVTGSGPMTGNGYTGNVAYTTFSALFVDSANGDVRPAVAGALLANLKPKVNTLDGRGMAYASSDIVGAWAALETAPSYPF